jgi:hypothetical protein
LKMKKKATRQELLPPSMTSSCPVTDTASRPPFRVTRSDFQLRDHVVLRSHPLKQKASSCGTPLCLVLVGTETIDHCCCKTRTTFTKPRLPSPLGHPSPLDKETSTHHFTQLSSWAIIIISTISNVSVGNRNNGR